ncbi:MAG: anaerobic ribonucleoside-triphosphate reductase activating protein [Patescibacteria group bacterium]|nr:anaerobic ribonucleoside-triphosphate reductase activating protein [Patescibacteria group bacterium]
MIIGGIQKNTLIDYPGKIAATIFVSGCNFKCPFCYNPELVLPGSIVQASPISLKDIYSFLEERKGFLEAVVICGGEPTIYEDIIDFAKQIKDMGYLVKLDTNGSNPEILKKMISQKLLDYIAMDIKAPKERYQELAGTLVDIEKIEQSISILKKKETDYEFRTTIVPGLLTKEDILKIVKWISPAKRYFLQNFQPKDKMVNSEFSTTKPYPKKYLTDIQKEIASFFDICEVR